MKIVFDISILGIGNVVPHVRAGTFRYVENLAYGLAKSVDCDLSFCAFRPLGQVNGCAYALNYLHDNAQLSQVPIVKPPLITPKIAAKRFLDHQINLLNDSINSANRFAVKQLHLRAARRMLDYTRRKIDAPPAKEMPKQFKGFEIFHSPSNFPLPEQRNGIKRVKRFVTIYDMVPIIYPDLFDFDVKSSFSALIDSLNWDDWVICISHSTRNDFLNHFKHIDPSKVIVTHLAASNLFYRCTDKERIASVQRKYGIRPDTQYFLSVSTLEPRKNLNRVIEAFSQFVQEYPTKDVAVVLVGAKGWKYESIFSSVIQKDWLTDRVLFTGYVPDEDLAPLYTGAIGFIYLSLFEGFGLPPLEAMQCGTPVIASNTSSLPEVIGDAGILLDPTDRDGLVQSLRMLYSSPEARANMSSRSLKRASQFSWDKCVQQTIAGYRAALES